MFYVISCYVISEWVISAWDHIAGTTFLYKIVLSVNLQKSIKCIVCYKNNTKLMFNPSVENTFIVFGRNIWLTLRNHQISLHKINKCSLHRQIKHSFILVVIWGICFNAALLESYPCWSPTRRIIPALWLYKCTFIMENMKNIYAYIRILL